MTTKLEKIFNNLGYFILVLLVIGQCTVGEWYLIGQGVYLVANTAGMIRSFVLKRPTADKVKDCCFVAITLALIILRVWG